MPIVHGKDAAIFVADSGAVARNLSTFTDSVEISWEADTSETTTLGAQSRTYVVGLRDHTLTLSGKWDNGATATPDQWMSGLLGHATAVQFTLFPAGSAAGAVFHRGSAFLTSYSASVPFDDVVSWSADFQCSGAVVRSTA